MNFIQNRLISLLLKTFLWGFSLLFGTLFVGVSALILFLSSGPLDLKGYKSYAEHAVQSYLPNSTLEFESAHLKWDPDNWEFALHASNAKIRSTATKNKYKTPKLHASWPLGRLLLFGFYPKTLNFKKPKLKIRHLHKNDDDGENDTEFLTTIQDAIANSPIEKVIISEAIVDLKTRAHGIWKLEKTNIVFQKDGNDINGAFVANIKDIGKVTGNLFTRDGKPNKLQIAFKQLNPKQILTHPNLKKTPFAKANEKHLADINTPLSGVLSLYFKDDFILDGYKFNFEFGEGTVKFDPYLPKTISLNSFKVRGECKNNVVVLKSLDIDTPYFQGQLDGTLNLSPSFLDPEFIQVDVKGTAKGLNFKYVDLLWPKGVSPITREWIIEHIVEGDLPGVTLNLNCNYNFKTDVFALNTLSGIFITENATLKYLEGLPLIKNIKAKARYDKDTFTTKFTGGSTFGQNITSGTIIISELQAEDQFIDINMNVEGPLEDALKIINVPRLKYADIYGLVPERAKGDTTSNLIFKFPLERTTTLDKVEIFVDSTIKNAFLSKVIEMPKVTLLKGDLKLDLTKKGMTIEGTGLLNKAKSKISLQENFEDSADWRTKLSVESSLSQAQFKDMGIPLGDYYKGKAPLKLNLTKLNNNRGNLSATLDLKNVNLTIPEFRTSSKVGEKGTLSLNLSMANGLPQKLESLKIDCGNSLKFACSGDFVKGTSQLNQLKISDFKTARDNYSGHVTRTSDGSYNAFLSGSYIDLDSFVQNRDDIDDSFLSTVPYFATIQFKKAEIKGKPFFTNLSAKLEQSSQGYMKSIDLKSELTNMTGRKDMCTLKLSSANNEQQLSMTLEDLGTVIAAFGAESDLKGGKTHIKASRKITQPLSPWEGEYYIKDFKVVKAPVLARLLKVVSPLAFVDIFTKGKGLNFASLKGGFMIKPDGILIKKSLAVGPSVGMTIQGLIDRKDDTLNMSGTIIPMYVLNSMVSYIPIVGQLLTGGFGEGLISISYTIQGSVDNPEIKSNPLSVVTPGIFRKMFDSKLVGK